MNSGVWLLLALLFASLPSVVLAADESASADVSSFTLQGGVEHSEKLEPVEKQYRHGAKLHADAEVINNPNNHWYELPDWAVGNWTTIRSTKLYAHDLKTNREQTSSQTRTTKMDFNWGFQQDNQGHVWEFAKEPYALIVDSAEQKVMKRILKREFLRASQSEVVLKTVTENVVVNKTTDQIIRTVQSESIQTCAPSPNECMSCNVSYKLFDEQGRPTELGKEQNFSKRVSAFKNIDQYEGKNMKEMFNEFLNSTGRSNLIN